MKAQYINELAEGSKVDAPFSLRSKEMRAARSGDAFLALEIADKTGHLSAVYFRPTSEASSVPVGAIVRIRGTVTSFRGSKRVSIDSMSPDAEYEGEDFLEASLRPREDMIAEFKRLAAGVRKVPLRRLLRAVFGDAAFLDRFSRCPGSQSYHHAYASGLIEHTIGVASICRTLCEQFPQADEDLLVCAALLHDIGKCDELSFDTSIQFSDQGRLLGHVVLGMQRIDRAISAGRVRIEPGLRARLEHAVLSHHGELEWGAPKRPSTFEALLLHHVDNLDAKASGFTSLLSGAVRADESWTDAANLFRRPLYAPRAAEDDRHYPASEDVVHSKMTA